MISPPLLQVDSWVCDLIDPNTGTWKSKTIRSIFLPHEADVIASIALNSHLPDDRLVWAPTPNGRFFIRSAYQIAMEMADGDMKGIVSDDRQLRKL